MPTGLWLPQVRGQIPSFTLIVSLPVLIPEPSASLNYVVVWEIKTGAIVKDIVINVQDLDGIVFSGYYTFTVVTDFCNNFRTYDALNGALLHEGEILPRSCHWLDGDWEHGESSRFATIGSHDGKPAIDINQLQPSSIPPCRMVESFILPPYPGDVSFSLTSFHASFFTQTEITVIDVRDSKILLRTEAPQALDLKSGRFSPDGGFFACGALENEIHVWKNTPTGYIPWSCLELRLPFDRFSFSPTSTSILAWGPKGVELLENHARVPLRTKTASDRDHEDHLVAYFKDGTRIATTRRGGNVITVLDPLSDAPQRSISAEMEILDIETVGDTVFTANARELAGWDLEAGEIVYRDSGAPVAEILVMGADPGIAVHFTLSTDGSSSHFTDNSWIAFAVDRTMFLYGIEDQVVFYKHTMDREVADIRFTPHGGQLCFTLDSDVFEKVCAEGARLSEQWRIVDVLKEFTEGVRLRDGPLPLHGYRIQGGSGWIEGHGDRKLLWLPPNWRTTFDSDAMWDGNFLTLVDGRHPMPIIIASQPQLIPPSPSTR